MADLEFRQPQAYADVRQPLDDAHIALVDQLPQPTNRGYARYGRQRYLHLHGPEVTNEEVVCASLRPLEPTGDA